MKGLHNPRLLSFPSCLPLSHGMARPRCGPASRRPERSRVVRPAWPYYSVPAWHLSPIGDDRRSSFSHRRKEASLDSFSGVLTTEGVAHWNEKSLITKFCCYRAVVRSGPTKPASMKA